MRWVMRTPRSTEGSYSSVSCGVLFMRSSRASRLCNTPCAAVRPWIDAFRFRVDPSTLTYTVACRRSGVVSTPVTVTSPMRGSFSSGSASASTWRTDSFTRRIRSVIAALVWQGRAQECGSDARGPREQKRDDDAAAQEEEQDQRGPEDAELPVLMQCSGQRDGDPEDGADRRRAGSVEKPPGVIVLPDAV